MKAKYLSMAALALMGVLASCQSDDDFTVARPDNAVSINFSVGSLQGTTRSNAIATDDTQREFNQGDQISVSTNDQEAVLFQCTSTENQTWTEAVPNKFLLWTQPMLTFSAYYPATTGTSMNTFTVPTDQSSVEKIALADYMTLQQVISRPEGGSDIQMQLERKMARVIVRISDFGSQYDDDEKTVSNVSIYSEASGIADGNSTGSSTEIQPYAQGNGGQGSTYTALVVPGYGDSGARFIQLTDGEYNTLLVKGIPELNAGNSYTFNLVVGKNKIEVASVTVQDWTTGETLAGGQAQEQGAAASVPAGAINGKFSVSDTKQVYFSKGNLRYASGTWSFFDNQYDYYTSYSADAWDKFGWSTSAPTYGMNTSTSDGTYSGDFADWGATMGTGWFTLTSDEWTYLFNTRSASTVGGTENGRYAKAKVNGVWGVILFPDTYTHPDGVTAPTGVNATGDTGWNGNNYTAADWTKMESAGCVFLPAAGLRDGSSVGIPGTRGSYWSATPNGDDWACYMNFDSDYLFPLIAEHRYVGFSVRLVRQVE